MVTQSSSVFQSRLFDSSVAFLALALAYCYLADRTQVFDKALKLYDRKEFLVLCALPLAIGTLSLRKGSDATSKNTPDAKARPPSTFLRRAVSDELKGWMIAVLVLCRWIGGSVDLRIYEITSLMASTFILLIGYHQTMRHGSASPPSLRVQLVDVVRYGILSVLLSYTQGTSILNYYFGPLLMFFTLSSFAAFRTMPNLNANPLVLVAKVAVLTAVVTLLHAKSPLVSALFKIARLFANVQSDPNQWRTIVLREQNMFSVGMIMGAVHLWVDSLMQQPTANL